MFSVEHDPTDLACEANVFRYRRRPGVLLRIGHGAAPEDVELVRRAAGVCGVRLAESNVDDESDGVLADRLGQLGIDRIRHVGAEPSSELRRAANGLGMYIACEPVTASGRVELQQYLREQAVSRTLHRFGNLIGARPVTPGPAIA